MLTEKGHVIAPKSTLREGADVWVHMYNWWLKPAKVLVTDGDNDLAILKVEHSTPLPCLKISATATAMPTDKSIRFDTFGIPDEWPIWRNSVFSLENGVVSKDTPAWVLRHGAISATPKAGVTRMVSDQGGAIQFAGSETMRAFIEANRQMLDGATPGDSKASAVAGFQASDALVLVMVLEKGSPAPIGSTAADMPPASQPAEKANAEN
jgi:hypothetical protein